MRRVLVVLGHPRSDSLCSALADAYARAAADAGAEVHRLNLGDLQFDPVLRGGFASELEPDLQRAQTELEWAEHVAWVYPVWWGNLPALLKGFCDRVLLPGFAFRYVQDQPFPTKLLHGRTARLLVTMDSPPWYYRWVIGAPAEKAMIKATLEFCGIGVEGRSY
ncbi:MAG: NAD(P)H-dependent oxidoreductase, partial [Deltaproteobacteria bacterium]|nr:NAD(P)H-dependent oxidoreductase [Deltaproteobacteria bacterium]